MKKLIAIFASALLLVGCSSITSGTITVKDHKDAYRYSTMQCSMIKSNGTCGAYITTWHNVPEKWYFGLDDGEETGWVTVSQVTYDQFEVGDYFEGKR